MRVVLCFLAISVFGYTGVTGEQPNVLMVVADDFGWGDLSANGNRNVATPHLDGLAESGLKFEKFYVCPTGSTTSASLLTGRYHYRTGVVGESGREAMMYGSEKTIGEAFAENGYRTAYFGHWYHGDNWPQNATGQGFAVYQKEGLPIECINRKEESPFFCLIKLPYPKLHSIENLTTEERLDRVNEGIAMVDQTVGQFLAALDSSDQRDNTIVIFLSDNGPDYFGEKDGRFNGYFYGGKGSVHEGGVRVPCLISWPGKITPGSRFTRIAAHIDWYPTLVALCQLESKSRQLPINGASLASVVLDGGNSENWPNRILFTSWTPPGYHLKGASVAARSDRWVALRDPRWRRDETVVEESGGWELYDLKTDPFQGREKGREYPFLLSELRADYSFWMDRTTDDGIGPVPIEIGHSESPTVIFRANSEVSWPVRVVRPGDYRIEVDFLEGYQCEMTIGDRSISVVEKTNVYLSDEVTEITISSGSIEGFRIFSSLSN